MVVSKIYLHCELVKVSCAHEVHYGKSCY